MSRGRRTCGARDGPAEFPRIAAAGYGGIASGKFHGAGKISKTKKLSKTDNKTGRKGAAHSFCIGLVFCHGLALWQKERRDEDKLNINSPLIIQTQDPGNTEQAETHRNTTSTLIPDARLRA